MPDPDYSHIGDHTETVQIDFDPKRITYGDLLRIFWESHQPDQRSWSRQYRNAVFFHNEAQRLLGLASKAAIENQMGRAVRTPVLPLRAFHRAEDYHQKYFLRRRSDLASELARIYPLTKAFVDSTAVARINGYVGGHGNRAQFIREMALLGLSQTHQDILYELIRRAD